MKLETSASEICALTACKHRVVLLPELSKIQHVVAQQVLSLATTVRLSKNAVPRYAVTICEGQTCMLSNPSHQVIRYVEDLVHKAVEPELKHWFSIPPLLS